MAEAMPTSQSCALCRQPATRACTACKADLDLVTVYYCSVDCQQTHWVKHKPECADGASRIALYRAARMARDLFLDFSKQTWAIRVLGVQKRGNVLSIAIKELSGVVIYFPFPEDLGLSAVDEAAVLSHGSCSSSMAYMWDIVSVLFSGEDVTFEEVYAKVAECPRHTCLTWPSGCSPDNSAMQYAHQFWRLRHKKNVYVLDLTSSQFGYHEALAPGKDYTDNIKIVFRRSYPGGHEKDDFPERPKIRYDECRLIHAELAYSHSTAIVKTMLEWEKSKNITMRRLLRMSRCEFDQESAELVQLCGNAISRSIQRFPEIAASKSSGISISLGLSELLKTVRATKSSNSEQQCSSSLISFTQMPNPMDYFEKRYEDLEVEQQDVLNTYLQMFGRERDVASRYTYMKGVFTIC